MPNRHWLAALASSLLAATAVAQAPAKGPTVGFMHAIHATNDVATTLEFYTDVFGLQGKIQPFANPAVPILTNSPGVSLRVSMLQLPGHGFNFELTEFTNTKRSPARPQVFDPGAPHMKILVRDLAPVVAALERRKAPIVTHGGKPVRVTTSLGTVEAIMTRDPDGYLVEAVQVAPPADAPPGNVVGSMMGVTVADLDESLKFWRDQLGFDLTAPAKAVTDPALNALLGLPKGAMTRTASGVVPGSNARIELMQIEGGPAGKPFDLRVPDPGASGMALRVAAIEQLLPKLKSAGVRVTSKDQALVEWSDTVRNVFVKDPNGLNLELVGNVGQ